jgi:predicted TIM-barrel fold metal-dependent hydrolase
MSQSMVEPMKARFPVIDAHNHIWGDWSKRDAIVKAMDDSGVKLYCDLTANVAVSWEHGGYSLRDADIGEFFKQAGTHFYAFTTATFARANAMQSASGRGQTAISSTVDNVLNDVLFDDSVEFQERTIHMLQDHVERGAKGLKILKELGLRYRDKTGAILFMDDERLAPIWDEAANLGIPVLAHQSDPYWFFEPITPENEHYGTLLKYPSWSFADRSRFPSKAELLERRDRTVRNHPRTTFILPHVANYPENLPYVARLLDDNPNVYIDFSARMDELGRKPQQSREFMIQYQDRILFGTDMPVSPELYSTHFRFLETAETGIIPPDYDGTFGRYRWTITGLELPDSVLKKIYHQNVQKIVPVTL